VISAVRDPRSAIRSPLLAIALVAALASTADAQTDSVRALLQVARRQASEGSAAAALDTLRKARARAPNAEDVLSAYAQMAIASRQPIVAVEVLEPLARMCPSVPQYQYMLGVAYMQAGAILASVDALRAAEALDPGNARVLKALGIALNTRKLHGEQHRDRAGERRGNRRPGRGRGRPRGSAGGDARDARPRDEPRTRDRQLRAWRGPHAAAEVRRGT
jgi:predicted Zn-dependent protease